MTSDIINNIKKMTNIIFAISVAAAAIPVKPNMPATIATIKNRMTQPNIAKTPF
jgi:hypothetical protein